MRPLAFYSVLGIGIIIVVGVVVWGLHIHDHVQTHSQTGASTASSSAPSLTGLSIYTNGKYGFSFFFPGTLKTQTTFDTQYLLPATWRVDALPNATGTPVIEVLGYQTTHENSYPRYFEAEVRVGASADPAEVAACTQATNSETAMSDATINGTTWHVFSFQDEAMMNALKGVSYRTVHDHTCIALEQIETWSTYRDDPSSAADIPQATLDQQYEKLAPIIQSFNFVQPQNTL